MSMPTICLKLTRQLSSSKAAKVSLESDGGFDGQGVDLGLLLRLQHGRLGLLVEFNGRLQSGLQFRLAGHDCTELRGVRRADLHQVGEALVVDTAAHLVCRQQALLLQEVGDEDWKKHCEEGDTCNMRQTGHV